MIAVTLNWIAVCTRQHRIRGRALDVGSRDINGNPRRLFREYVGLDIEAGANVDVVGSAYDLAGLFGGESFDIVLCLSVLEHLQDLRKALTEIRGVLRRGGYFFASVPGFGFPSHDFPKDYWRFSEDAVKEFVMEGFHVLDFHSYRTFNKLPMIDCLGRKA